MIVIGIAIKRLSASPVAGRSAIPAITTGCFTVIFKYKLVGKGILAGWKAITVVGAPLRASPSRYLEAFIKLTLMVNRWYESRNPQAAGSFPFGRSRVPVFFAFLFISIPCARRFAVGFTRGATFNKRFSYTSRVLFPLSFSLFPRFLLLCSLPLWNRQSSLPSREDDSLLTSLVFSAPRRELTPRLKA